MTSDTSGLGTYLPSFGKSSHVFCPENLFRPDQTSSASSSLLDSLSSEGPKVGREPEGCLRRLVFLPDRVGGGVVDSPLFGGDSLPMGPYSRGK